MFNDQYKKYIELFKLHLLNKRPLPYLPDGFDYKKNFTDYLHEMGKVNYKWFLTSWAINFYTLVLIVLTVNKIFFYEFCCEIRFIILNNKGPAEFDDTAMASWRVATMRECVFKAG